MAHLLVKQLQFARSRFAEGLDGISAEDGQKRLEPMNSIGWVVGHLATFEQFSWLTLNGKPPINAAVNACGFGKPASTPPLAEMLSAWREITTASNSFLDTLDAEALQTTFVFNGEPFRENIGTMLLRHTGHYWYHTGEVQAIRQLLGHDDLIPFVGRIPPEYQYQG